MLRNGMCTCYDADCSNVSEEIGQLYLIHLSWSRNHEFTYGTRVERDQSSQLHKFDRRLIEWSNQRMIAFVDSCYFKPVIYKNRLYKDF